MLPSNRARGLVKSDHLAIIRDEHEVIAQNRCDARRSIGMPQLVAVIDRACHKCGRAAALHEQRRGRDERDWTGRAERLTPRERERGPGRRGRCGRRGLPARGWHRRCLRGRTGCGRLTCGWGNNLPARCRLLRCRG